MTILLVIAILALLIIVHELGHFIAAKISRVRVQEFGVGYPPTALSLGRIGETELTLNWIPFGGFVRLFGDAGENERGPGSFMAANRGKQALILFAGVAMNMLAGWLLFTGSYALGIPRPVDASSDTTAAQVQGSQLFIADVVQGSPAESAGIKPGDELVGVVDNKGAVPHSLSPAGVREFVSERGGKELEISYVRNGATSTTGVIPANAVIPGQSDRAGVGIDLVLITSTPLSLVDAAVFAFKTSINAFVAVGQNLWTIIKQDFTGALNLQGIVGPVGLVSVVGDASNAGIAQILALAGFISINLAVINLVPLPLLAGGRIVIVAIESVIRRRTPKLAIHLLNTVGIIMIGLLMVVVTYHDIARLVT